MPKNPTLLFVLLSLLSPLTGRAQGPAAPPGSTPPATQGGIPVPGIAGAAGPAAPKEDEPPTDAEKTIDAAVVALRALTSFSAEITQSVDMLNQKFEVKGTYLRASENRMYLKLAVSDQGDLPATTLQVCDGVTRWDYQQILESRSYRKLTMASIFKKLNDPVIDAPVREQVLSRLGFTGPEAMLVGLRKAVRFDQKSAETLDGKKVWVIRGQWKDRSGILGPNQQPLPATVPLPAYVPSTIAITLGQDDHWPYKIEMVGKNPSLLQMDTRKLGLDGRPMGPKVAAPKVDPSRIILRYSNVKINPEVGRDAFAFTAPADGKNVIDETDDFNAFLDKVIQQETMTKKAEAAKSESLIPGSLDVPSPPPTDPAAKPAAAPPK